MNEKSVIKWNVKRIFRFLGKFLLILLCFVISLLLVSVAVIQFKPVRQFALNKLLNSVTAKTNSIITANDLHFYFTGNVDLKGLFVGDEKSDTILSAGNISFRIGLMDLLHGNIDIHNVVLSDANLKLVKTDSVFNFSFIIDKLSSKDKQADTIQNKKSSVFKIDQVRMETCRFAFTDNVSGADISLNLKELNLKIDSIDLVKLKFNFNELVLSDAIAEVNINPGISKGNTSETANLPVFIIQDVSLDNFIFSMVNKVDSQRVFYSTIKSDLNSLNFDLNGNYFALQSLTSRYSKVFLNNDKTILVEDNIADISNSALHLKISKATFVNNEIQMGNAISGGEKNKFNAAKFHLKKVNGVVSKLIYSDDSIGAEVSNLNAFLDQEIHPVQFSGKISRVANNISASDLDLQYGQTALKGDLFASYDFSDRKGKMEVLNAGLDLTKVAINQKDLLYFVSDSLEKKYLSKPWPSIEMKIKANGNMEKIVVNQFYLRAGNTTSIESNFTLTKIDNPDLIGFDIPIFNLYTSRADIELIPIPGLIPHSLKLPEVISVRTEGKGTVKNFNMHAAIFTSIGNIDLLAAMKDKSIFNGDMKVMEFNVGRLLKMEDQLGPVTMQLSFNGSGFTPDDLKANINLISSSFVYNKYNYHDLSIVGNIAGRSFAGIVELNDTNAEFKIDGLVDLSAGIEKIKVAVDIQGVNLQKLNFTKENIRFSSNAIMDFNGLKYDSLAGSMAVHNIIIVKNENIYRLDSLLFASVNDSSGNRTKMESAILVADFTGAFSPINLFPEIKNTVNRYFPISDTIITGDRNDFSFNISLRNHPVLKDVFLPDLEEFSTIEVGGNFNKKDDSFNAALKLPFLKYAGMKLENFVCSVSADSSSLAGSIGFKEISNEQFKIDSLNVNTVLKDSIMKFSVLNLNGDEKKLSFSAEVVAASSKDFLLLLPRTFILNSDEWIAAGSDSIHLRKDLPVTVSMDITKQNEHIQIKRDVNGNGKIVFTGFQIENIFQLVSRDSTLASGVLYGNITLADKSLSGILNLNDIKVKEYPIGNIYVKANQLPAGFSFMSTLEGNENMVEVAGDITSADNVSVLNVIADIKNVSMKSIEGLSMGNLSSSAGNISGKIKVTGTTAEPELEGKLQFSNIVTVPTSINSLFSIPNSTLEINDKKLLFHKFSMRDSEGKNLIVDGYIDMKNMTNPDLSINISSEEFELFNSPKAQKKMFYGRLIADSKIDINGSLMQPVIKARLGVKKGTDFTFAIPKSGDQSDRGGNEVVFKLDRLNTILTSGNRAEIGKSDYKNVTVESLLEIDKGAILRILPDPDSGDSLIVQGAAALNFGLDRTGRMSLTGSYELEDGSYVVSLENLVKKRFKIQQGSRIDWNGDPLNAEIDLKAMYEVRTSPADLLANEFSSNSSLNNDYKERLPFQVFLFLKGDLKAPVITFEIQLPASSRGALGGMVNEKLILLNNDPSELNKQVFALLVLNRFIQEDPLASSTEGSAAENVARSSVSRFLSNQLNKLSSQYINGVELNFDLQSYNDYGSNSGEGRTELAVGIKKNINDRISVQVGGSVEVEGAKAKDNSLADWTGDFVVEYKLTDDGEYRLKGFRRNQYEGLVEGQLVETGVGLLFVKDFDLWKDLFKENSVKAKGYESPENK